MFGEGNGELGGHPPHLPAPGDVGCGRENSLPLGGGRKWCRGQPGVSQSKKFRKDVGEMGCSGCQALSSWSWEGGALRGWMSWYLWEA